MAHFLSVLKVFLEKQYNQTLLAVVFMVVAYLLFPWLNSIQQKLGSVFFWFTLFCFCLSLVNLCRWQHKRMSQKNQLKKLYKRDANKNAEVINRLYDSLSLRDKEIILTFITTGNKPLKIREVDTFNSDLFRKEYLFNITSASSDVRAQCDEYWLLPEMIAILSLGKPITDSRFRLYKLEGTVFELFKGLYLHQGKLGNF